MMVSAQIYSQLCLNTGCLYELRYRMLVANRYYYRCTRCGSTLIQSRPVAREVAREDGAIHV